MSALKTGEDLGIMGRAGMGWWCVWNWDECKAMEKAAEDALDEHQRTGNKEVLEDFVREWGDEADQAVGTGETWEERADDLAVNPLKRISAAALLIGGGIILLALKESK